MDKRGLFLFALIFLTCLTGCMPVPKVNPTSTLDFDLALTEVAGQYSSTLTASVPTITPTPLITKTPRPTPTIEIGTFSHPASINDEIMRAESETALYIMSAKLLDVKRGAEAKELALSNLDWMTYKEPIEGQEYLAVYIKLGFINTRDTNQLEVLYPYWHLTLRNHAAALDIWSVDPVEKWNEGYGYLEGEGWVFFLISDQSNPYLYFHPCLIAVERLGIKDGGGYFQLTQ